RGRTGQAEGRVHQVRAGPRPARRDDDRLRGARADRRGVDPAGEAPRGKVEGLTTETQRHREEKDRERRREKKRSAGGSVMAGKRSRLLGISSPLFLSLLCALCVSVVQPGAEDWPCWRGPVHNGISAEKGWLDKWPEKGPPVAWKASVGTGFSSV